MLIFLGINKSDQLEKLGYSVLRKNKNSWYHRNDSTNAKTYQVKVMNGLAIEEEVEQYKNTQRKTNDDEKN